MGSFSISAFQTPVDPCLHPLALCNNEAVRCVTCGVSQEENMNSSHLSNKAAIGKYVPLCSSQLAICNFSNKLEINMKVALVQN